MIIDDFILILVGACLSQVLTLLFIGYLKHIGYGVFGRDQLRKQKGY